MTGKKFLEEGVVVFSFVLVLNMKGGVILNCKHNINLFTIPEKNENIKEPDLYLVGLVPLGNRVMAMAAPGVASGYPAQPHPDTSQRAPFLDGIDHILATRWFVPAVCPHHRRKGDLIEPDRPDE